MISQPTQTEISKYKSQLDGFLASKFIDQSLILGFTTVIQSKFRQWIVDDVEQFHQLFVETKDIKQVDVSLCNSIELLKVVWSDFHHPIVKSYQKQHAELYNVSVQSLKGPKKNFKTVEMRKLNEMFSKYVKAVKAFYTGVMTDLGKKYANPLIPQKYLQEFDIVIPSCKDDSSYTDFHTTLSFVTFLCLVGLGNVSRNWAQVKLTYVDPTKSVSVFYKHLKSSNTDKAQGKSLYIFPLLCYSKCVGLLPTMHEPYNHIGVIYNSLGQKFSAILWFLRSQFTRDTNIAVGRRNLLSAFTRPWLEEAYDLCMRKAPESMVPEDANTIFLRIIGDYFYSSAFRKSLYTEKAESDFLNLMFSEPYHEQYVKNTNAIAEHLTVFICFYEFALEAREITTRDRFGAFLARYIAAYLGTLKTSSFHATDAETPLKNIRLILAFVRKNKVFFKSSGHKFLDGLVDAFNALQDFDGEDTRARITDSFMEGKPPIRSHYFSEDIHFKDFAPIGFQFKDFNDNHLFESGNIHLLFGSYFYENEQGMPEFLDNEAVLRINKEVELASGEKFSRENAIAAECSRSENILRLQASVVLAKTVYGTRIHLDSAKERFEVEKLNVPKTQPSKVPEKAPRKRNKAKSADKQKLQQKSRAVKPSGETSTGVKANGAKQVDSSVLLSTPAKQENREPSVQVVATLPSSIEEIGSMIFGHAPKLMNKAHESDRDEGLADMVSAIVSEDETRDTLTTAGDGMQDVSNDGLSKSTESSRIETGHFAEQTPFFYPPNGQILPQASQQFMPLGEMSQGASFDRSGYQSSPIAQPQKYAQSQEHPNRQASFMPQQPQWHMGFNGSQMAPGMPYGANMAPPAGFHPGPMGPQNGIIYPGMPQYHSSQNMPPIPGNTFAVCPPPYMMPQYPHNMAAQDGQGNGYPHGSGPNYMYPQYSSQ
ncbi:hypothetical protein JCM33374_g6224 [Metschnikowia sp. JCM 33374]|nr:hypothetical protein JCM33374_g6224 [Metschnikowia sp. JCM 33374]